MRLRALKQDEYQAIRDEWNSMVMKAGTGVLGFDVTATYEWAMALWDSHLQGVQEEILLLEDGGQVKGVIPLYRSSKRLRSVACRQISPLYELYSQRSGFPFQSPCDDSFRFVMHNLFQQAPSWDICELTVVDGSTTALLLTRFLNEKRTRYEVLGHETSPYMMLSPSWSAFLERLSPKFRSNLRAYEKKFRALGEVSYRHYRDAGKADEFLESMLAIERESWKETAGTSITGHAVQQAFYERFIEVASERGWFSGHLLLLGSEPVAYIYGLTFNNCFSSMKTSYKSKYQKMGTGHLVRMFALQQLHADGVAMHDFTGLCEEHKLAWADRTYTRTTYRIYNRTVRSCAVHVWGSVARLWARG
jgi:hypothetical protein